MHGRHEVQGVEVCMNALLYTMIPSSAAMTDTPRESPVHKLYTLYSTLPGKFPRVGKHFQCSVYGGSVQPVTTPVSSLEDWITFEPTSNALFTVEHAHFACRLCHCGKPYYVQNDNSFVCNELTHASPLL